MTAYSSYSLLHSRIGGSRHRRPDLAHSLRRSLLLNKAVLVQLREIGTPWRLGSRFCLRVHTDACSYRRAHPPHARRGGAERLERAAAKGHAHRHRHQRGDKRKAQYPLKPAASGSTRALRQAASADCCPRLHCLQAPPSISPWEVVARPAGKGMRITTPLRLKPSVLLTTKVSDNASPGSAGVGLHLHAQRRPNSQVAGSRQRKGRCAC